MAWNNRHDSYDPDEMGSPSPRSIPNSFDVSAESNPHSTVSKDREFLLSLDRQLADAVTFLPPTMRASFHAQVGALIRLAQTICEGTSDMPSDARDGVDHVLRTLRHWRVERARIAERTR